jgi:hypothetical protein
LLIATFALSLAACDRKSGSGSSAGTGSNSAAQPTNRDEKTLTTPDGRKITKGSEITPPDLTAATKSSQFQAAIKRVTELTGAQAKPLHVENDDPKKPPAGVEFDVAHDAVEKSLDAWRKDLLSKGAYLVRMDNSFGIGGGSTPDKLALLPTTDKYAVLATIQTDGANYDITTGDIIDWLKGMEKSQPFELTEAGLDFCAGRFTTPLKDAATLSKQMYEFCPDIVDQGTGDVDKLESELGKGAFFLWWD